MFVGATAVSLEQEGTLDLTQPIARYLPELGADSELGKVTLHELLTHTSGIIDPADSPLCVGDGTLESVLARARLAAPAGAVYVYSNLGYSLAGLVIEHVARKPFEEVVRDRALGSGVPDRARRDRRRRPLRGAARLSLGKPCGACRSSGLYTRRLSRTRRAASCAA